MNSQKLATASKAGSALQYARRVARSTSGKLLLAVAVVIGVVCVPLLIRANDPNGRDRNSQDKSEHEREESKIRQGFAIAPVPLDLEGKNPALVGLGSYIVNAQSFCNGCHSTSVNEWVPGGNPFLGEPEQIDPARYLIGGRQFGAVGVGPRSRNLTPDPVTGLPAGFTFEEFAHVMRTGEDLRHLAPTVPSAEVDLLQTMPWPNLGMMTDRDLRAIYEYLKSVPSRAPGTGFPL